MKILTKHGHGIKTPKKRIIIIIASVIVVGAIGTYALLSVNYWRGYSDRSYSITNYLYDKINLTLGESSSNTPVTQQMDTIISDFDKAYGKEPCATVSFYSWQLVFSGLKDLENACSQRVKTSVAVIDTMKPVNEFLKAESKANEILKKAQEATADTTDYAAASTTWKNVADSAEISKDPSFKEIHDQIISTSNAISIAYANLVTSSKNEDKDNFDIAVADLTAAYGQIGGLKTNTLLERTDAIKVFTDAYKKL